MEHTARAQRIRSAGERPNGTGGRNRDLIREALAHSQDSDRGGQATRMTKGGGLRKIEDQIQLWQTPGTDSFRSRGGDRKDEMGLDQQARACPTAKARDFRSTSGGGRDEAAEPGPECDCGGIPDFPPGPNERERWEQIPEFLWPAIEPDLRLLVDGLAVVVDESRSDQLRCCGNGVFPLAAAVALAELATRAGIAEELGVIHV